MKYINEVGSFLCQVVEPENGWFSESKEKGTPCIVIPCIVNDPNSSQHGAMISYTGWLSDGAIDRTIKDLVEVLGFDGDLQSLESGDQTFAGKECVIVTESETYEGKERIKAKWINAVGRQGGGAPAMEKAKVSSLLAKIGGRAKAVAKAAQSASPATTKPTPKGGSPF